MSTIYQVQINKSEIFVFFVKINFMDIGRNSTQTCSIKISSCIHSVQVICCILVDVFVHELSPDMIFHSWLVPKFCLLGLHCASSKNIVKTQSAINYKQCTYHTNATSKPTLAWLKVEYQIKSWNNFVYKYILYIFP